MDAKQGALQATAAMEPPIYLVGGSKGGVGKSLVSMALLDLLWKRGTPTLLIESDTSNPDVLKSYEAKEERLETVALGLDVKEGWMDLVNVSAKGEGRVVVINTGARNNKGVGEHGELLTSSLEEMNRKLVTLWVINEHRDSLELLREYLEAIPTSVVHVVRNCHFVEEDRFTLYNDSRLRRTVEERGGMSLSFPALAARITAELYSKRKTISEAMKELPLGDRAELKRWRGEVERVLGPVLGATA